MCTSATLYQEAMKLSVFPLNHAHFFVYFFFSGNWGGPSTIRKILHLGMSK